MVLEPGRLHFIMERTTADMTNHTKAAWEVFQAESVRVDGKRLCFAINI